MTQPRHPYKPWTEPSQVNPSRISVGDDTPTQATVFDRDRRGPRSGSELLKQLGEVVGTKGSWQEQNGRSYAATGKASGRKG